MFFRHLGMAKNAAQNIVEVVGDTTAERAHCFHATGLLQARLQARAFVFHGMPFQRIHDRIKRHPEQAEFAGGGDTTGSTNRAEPQGDTAPSFVTLVAHAHPSRPSATQASLFSPIGRRSTRGTWIIPSADGANRAINAIVRRSQSGGE